MNNKTTKTTKPFQRKEQESEFIGQIIDVFNNHLSEDGKEDCMIPQGGDDYKAIADSLRTMLQKWGVLEPAKKNTEIEILYRDASNYKLYSTCVVAGTLTETEIQEIIDCLEDRNYFIPEQVGLYSTRFSEETEDDGPWFELTKDDFSATGKAPDTEVTAQELLANFRKAKGHWEAEY